jgi:hypothetical protein
MIQKLAVVLALAAGMLFVPATTFAAYNGVFGDVCESSEAQSTQVCKDQAITDNPVTETIGNVVDLVSIIAGSVAVIMVIFGGIRFVISSGDAAKVASARQTVLYALVGLVVIVFSNAIIKFVLTRI